MVSGEYRWRGGLCLEVSPIPNTIVIFGAAGDLACRKLMPALFNLYRRDLLHEKSKILACARGHRDPVAYREQVRKACLVKGEGCQKLEAFLDKLHCLDGDFDDPQTYSDMAEALKYLEKDTCCNAGRIFYLSTPSSIHSTIVGHLADAGLVTESDDGIPCRHVVLEKPFGFDLESAKSLDRALRKHLHERQIYRIDHYLGKETVQNILMLRFANLIFEPVWSRDYIANVQITVAETVGVEHRAGYYEQAGLLRDMFQNHMLEMLSLVAMEMPSSFDAGSVRDEKAKLLKSIRPFDTRKIGDSVLRAQYAEGSLGGKPMPGYRSEPGVSKDSTIETFVAAKFLIDNLRWKGVPFLLRSGKRLPKRVSEIAINFKRIPHSIFTPVKAEDMANNQLVLNVQPQEGLSLTIQAKQPGPKLCMGSLTMDFKYSSILEKGETMPDAYERLLLDCMLGDQTLFIRSDTIEHAWGILTPILEAWKSGDAGAGELATYPAGTWGPSASDDLAWRDGVIWRNP